MKTSAWLLLAKLSKLAVFCLQGTISLHVQITASCVWDLLRVSLTPRGPKLPFLSSEIVVAQPECKLLWSQIQMFFDSSPQCHIWLFFWNSPRSSLGSDLLTILNPESFSMSISSCLAWVTPNSFYEGPNGKNVVPSGYLVSVIATQLCSCHTKSNHRQFPNEWHGVCSKKHDLAMDPCMPPPESYH